MYICTHHGTTLTSDTDKAEAFCMHFSTIFTCEDTSVLSSLHSELPPNNNATLLDTVTIFPDDVHHGDFTPFTVNYELERDLHGVQLLLLLVPL